jgi:hypothetical protein
MRLELDKKVARMQGGGGGGGDGGEGGGGGGGRGRTCTLSKPDSDCSGFLCVMTNSGCFAAGFFSSALASLQDTPTQANNNHNNTPVLCGQLGESAGEQKALTATAITVSADRQTQARHQRTRRRWAD